MGKEKHSPQEAKLYQDLRDFPGTSTTETQDRTGIDRATVRDVYMRLRSWSQVVRDSTKVPHRWWVKGDSNR